MSETTFVKVSDLTPGTVLDLEGDLYADPLRENVEFEFDYQTVEEVELEDKDTVVLTLESGRMFGFPRTHKVRVVQAPNG